ncbi:MAG: serine hydrolase [Chloroflexota bacterium]|nr:serine hydrolase [Chloroflexota bacterium]
MSSRPRPRRSRLCRPTLRERASLFLPLRSWRLQLFGAGLAVAAAIISAQSFASAREAAASYVIQPGDNLLAIAAATGVQVERLVSLNAITNPDFIVAGQALSLDGAPQTAIRAAIQSASDAPPEAHYTVKPGDTLWDISQSNGVSADGLAQLNNLSNADQLSVGQVLRLPAAAAAQHSAMASSPKPKPTPSPQAKSATSTRAPASSSLQQRVAAEVLRVGGPNVHVGVAAVNLSTGEKLNLHADDAFPSASVMKLPILVELERQTATGALPWTESLRAEASAMIAVSDNSAANQIADLIHPRSVNDTMARLGLGATHFVNLFTDSRGPSAPGMNQTTPSNMAWLLQLIATDQVVSQQASADIRNLMARNADRSKLVRLLPPDARVAHKSGWYEGVANDVGIVTVDRVPTRWTIAVFTENLPDDENGNQVIAAVSKLVYDAWAPQ